MTKRTLIIVVLAAAALIGGAIALRAHGGGTLTGWFQHLHGH